MEANIYILYSRKLDRYYIGSTELKPEERLELHLSKYYGSSKFTAKADDWELRFCINNKKSCPINRTAQNIVNNFSEKTSI